MHLDTAFYVLIMTPWLGIQIIQKPLT